MTWQPNLMRGSPSVALHVAIFDGADCWASALHSVHAGANILLLVIILAVLLLVIIFVLHKMTQNAKVEGIVWRELGFMLSGPPWEAILRLVPPGR